jgi:hypothetical protein
LCERLGQDGRGVLRLGGIAAGYHAGMNEAVLNQIVESIVKADDPSFSVELSQHFLTIEFGDDVKERVNLLSEKAREGTLTVDEDEELKFFVVVSHFVGAWKAKARNSLRQRNEAGEKC